MAMAETERRRMEIGANLEAALHASRGSPNRVRQVGAVLVAGEGTVIAACNTFPPGVRDEEERHAGDGRFVWMEHAERAAIFEAARRGVATAGAHLTTTFFPCIDCARAIVLAGIACLDTPEPDLRDPVWGESFLRSRVILEEGGVEMRFLGAPEARGLSDEVLRSRQPVAAIRRSASRSAATRRFWPRVSCTLAKPTLSGAWRSSSAASAIVGSGGIGSAGSCRNRETPV